MATWNEFVAAAPVLGALAQSRLDDVGLVLVGTLRANGWPRVSPVEPLVSDGELYLGMMWRSRKALDLLADPRCVVHSVVSNADGSEGDVKLYGRARVVTDVGEVDRYGAALFARIGWRPDGEFHLFALDIIEVGYFRSGGGAHEVRHWQPGRPEEVRLPEG
jgi:hypothetical protein